MAENTLLEKNEECTIYWSPGSALLKEIKRVVTYKPLQILSVFPVQTAIRFPDPIPAWRVSPTCCKEHYGVVRLDWYRDLISRMTDVIQ